MPTLRDKFKLTMYQPIVVYLFLFIIISVTAITSAFPLIDMQYGVTTQFVVKQLVFYVLGLFIAMGIVLFGNERIRSFRWWLYGFGMILLIGLFLHQYTPLSIPFVKKDTNGAIRWYDLPFIGSFQPSEVMKIGIMLVVADLIQKHNDFFDGLKRTWKTDLFLLCKVVAIILPPSLLIFKQPDSGLVMIILVCVAFMIFASGIKWRYVLGVATLGVTLIGIFMVFVVYNPDFLTEVLGVDQYKMNRFYGWFDPFGTINHEGHQLALGLVAIGSGGLFGNGYQSMTQFFPEPHTDFIFAIIGMDFGFIGTLLTVSVCLFFDLEILNIAKSNRNHYNCYVCMGILGMILFQQFQNIGMTIGLLPITGVTLPFISYGGSSLVSFMMVFGMILSANLEGVKIKHMEATYFEKTLYLKTKPYLKPKAYKT